MKPPSERMETIKILEERLADLKARLPAHSIPARMLIELEEIEEQLADLRAHQPQPPAGKPTS